MAKQISSIGEGECAALVFVGDLAARPPVLLPRPITIAGTRRSSHIRLKSRSISRAHAVFVSTTSGVYVRDLCSREGTFVNEAKITEAELRDGDALRLGKFVFRFRAAASQNGNSHRKLRPAHVIVDGKTRVDLSRRVVLIGQRPGSDIRIADDKASMVHAVIFQYHGRHYLRDLGTSEGTRVNGAVVKISVLRTGDSIRIGRSQLRYFTVSRSELARQAQESSIFAAIGVEAESALTATACPAPETPKESEPVAAYSLSRGNPEESTPAAALSPFPGTSGDSAPVAAFAPSPGTPGEGWGGGSADDALPANDTSAPTLTLPRSTGGGDDDSANSQSAASESKSATSPQAAPNFAHNDDSSESEIDLFDAMIETDAIGLVARMNLADDRPAEVVVTESAPQPEPALPPITSAPPIETKAVVQTELPDQSESYSDTAADEMTVTATVAAEQHVIDSPDDLMDMIATFSPGKSAATGKAGLPAPLTPNPPIQDAREANAPAGEAAAEATLVKLDQMIHWAFGQNKNGNAPPRRSSAPPPEPEAPARPWRTALLTAIGLMAVAVAVVLILRKLM